MLKPFDLQQNTEMPPEIQEILQDSGLATPKVDTKNKASVRKVFDDAGASVASAAGEITRVMQFGETDAGRLKAAELVLKVHGVVNEIENATIPQITINILGQGNTNNTLLNLVVPNPQVLFMSTTQTTLTNQTGTGVPKVKRTFRGFYRHRNTGPVELFFDHAGDLKSAKERFQAHCRLMGYFYIQVTPMIMDLDKREALRNQTESDTNIDE